MSLSDQGKLEVQKWDPLYINFDRSMILIFGEPKSGKTTLSQKIVGIDDMVDMNMANMEHYNSPAVLSGRRVVDMDHDILIGADYFILCGPQTPEHIKLVWNRCKHLFTNCKGSSDGNIDEIDFEAMVNSCTVSCGCCFVVDMFPPPYHMNKKPCFWYKTF